MLSSEEHLSKCPRCKKRLAQAEAVIAALRRPLADPPVFAA